MTIDKMRKMSVVLEILVVLAIFTNIASATISPPTNVYVELSDDTLTVGWTKSIDTTVTGYRIHVYNTTGSSNTIINSMTTLVDANTTSTMITVPFIDNCYIAHVRAMVGTSTSSSVYSNEVCGTINNQIITPPGSITNLNNVSYAQDYINWTWTNPSDSDFSKVMIYINGVFRTNVSSLENSYNATNLNPNTIYKIGTHTVDINGTINLTWVNNTSVTAKDDIPPNSIRGLYNTSYASNYINWKWIDPSDTDLDHVDIYINGTLNGSVLKGAQTYTLSGLSPNIYYEIGTRTVDTSGNINDTWVNNTSRTANIPLVVSGNVLRIMTIGDPHLSSSTSSDSYKNLTKVVNYINTRNDVDLTVVLGDISSLSTAKTILGKLKKPYRVVAGNHDITTISQFNGYFGFPASHVETFNGFQLIFVGIKGTVDKPVWSFDYSTISDKTRPTIIFNHGPVQPKGSGTCSNWGSYYGYACDMKSETDKFTNLLGYYAGHVHTWTNKKIGKTLYVTEDNIGGAGEDSLYIGYTIIKDGVASYTRVRY